MLLINTSSYGYKSPVLFVTLKFFNLTSIDKKRILASFRSLIIRKLITIGSLNFTSVTTAVKTYSLLRSPHVHKKSFEQLATKKYIVCLTFEWVAGTESLIFLLNFLSTYNFNYTLKSI